MVRITCALLSFSFVTACVGEVDPLDPHDDDLDSLEATLTGSGSAGSGKVCRYKTWSEPVTCTYQCIGDNASVWTEPKTVTLGGSTSCAAGSCATASAAAQAGFQCPSGYPQVQGGMITANCRLVLGPSFGPVTCTAVY